MSSRTRTSIALVVAVAATTSFAVGSGQASAPPVGPLPNGPVSTITTTKGEYVAFALPEHHGGLVWRVARPFKPGVLNEVREQSGVGGSLVIVFKAIAVGSTSITYGLTRGEREKALQSRRFDVRVS
jgi:predicted secreted protein